MSEHMTDVGQMLKAERELRSLTLDTVHEATKIPIDSLRAIEEGYKIRSLTGFYYKSFVRIYAQYLGIDATNLVIMAPVSETILRKATVSADPIAGPKAKAPRDTRQLNLFARSNDGQKSFQKIFKIGIPLVIGIVVLVVIVGAVSRARRNASTTPSTKSLKTDKVKSEVKKADAQKTVAAAPVVKKVVPVAVSSESPEVAKAVKRASLAVRARSTIFIFVKADGLDAFRGNLKKGMSETWNASKKIELSGKDLDQLDYEANGKPVGKTGRVGSRLKRVIVTPEGVTFE